MTTIVDIRREKVKVGEGYSLRYIILENCDSADLFSICVKCTLPSSHEVHSFAEYFEGDRSG